MGWLVALLAAPFVGSFLGVLITRLPAGQPVVWSRSRCDACGAGIAARDMVPLASYAVLGGRCRRCGSRISPLHWRIEAAACLVPASALLAGLDGVGLWAACGAGWILLALAWIDATCMLLPDVLTLPLILAGLLATWWLQPDALTEHALAAALGWTTFFAVAETYRWLRGREGLGKGDAKLFAALGAWVGLSSLPMLLLGSAVTALLWAVGRSVAMRRRGGQRLHGGMAIPFGPFLIGVGWLLLLLTLRDYQSGAP